MFLIYIVLRKVFNVNIQPASHICHTWRIQPDLCALTRVGFFFRLIRRLSSLVGEENIELIMAADEGERGQEEKRRSRNHRSQLPVSAIKAKSGEGSRMRKTRRGQVARKT